MTGKVMVIGETFPMPAPGGAEIGLSALTGRIAAELGQLTGLAQILQDLLSAILAEAPSPPPGLAGLQVIDRLAQNMGELASLMTALSAASPRDATVNAALIQASIRLGDLSRRLLADGAPVTRDVNRVVAGEVLWF